MPKTTFEEIQPIMEACTKAELTKNGAPWDQDRKMVSPPPAGYLLNNSEFKIACKNIQNAFNANTGNSADLSDPTWQNQYASQTVRIFISAASYRARDQANPPGQVAV